MLFWYTLLVLKASSTENEIYKKVHWGPYKYYFKWVNRHLWPCMRMHCKHKASTAVRSWQQNLTWPFYLRQAVSVQITQYALQNSRSPPLARQLGLHSFHTRDPTSALLEQCVALRRHPLQQHSLRHVTCCSVQSGYAEGSIRSVSGRKRAAVTANQS